MTVSILQNPTNSTTPTNNPSVIDARKRASASMEIEDIYNSCPETTYIESILQWCDLNEVEYEDASKFLAEALKQKLYNESVKFRLLKDQPSRTMTLQFLM